MKGKIVGYLVSAVFIVVVMAIVFRIGAVKNFVLGSNPPAA